MYSVSRYRTLELQFKRAIVERDSNGGYRRFDQLPLPTLLT